LAQGNICWISRNIINLTKMANRGVSPIRVLSPNQQWMVDNKDDLAPTAPKRNEKYQHVYDGAGEIPEGLRHLVRVSNRRKYTVCTRVIATGV
jgi:hypothetical protein